MSVRKFFIAIYLGGLVLSAYSQEFYRSGILQQFKSGQYEKVRASIEAWLATATADQEVAHYFLGECHYNLGLEAKEKNLAISHFQKAIQHFDEALQFVSSGSVHSDLYDDMLYKKGWACFRLAELQDPPLEFLQRAKEAFEKALTTEDDSLRMQAEYMIGETALRWAMYDRLSRHASGVTESSSRAIQILHEAKERFQHVQTSGSTSSLLKAVASICAEDVRLEQGLWERQINADLFSELENIPVWGARPAVLYSRQMAHFYRGYFGNEESWKQVGGTTELGGFAKDVALLSALIQTRSILDEFTPWESQTFLNKMNAVLNDLEPISNQRLEALYWMGCLQYVLRFSESQDSFNRFLQQTEFLHGDIRWKILRESAKYHIFLIQFEQAMGGKGVQLTQLQTQLQNFKPETQLVREKRDLLLRLVQVILNPQRAWETAVGSTETRLNEMFYLIRNLLVRANQCVGQDRRRILNAIQVLLNFTQHRRPAETQFYRGLYHYLDAEIQVLQKAKKAGYQRAEEVSREVKGEFEWEARYVQARSLLSAEDYDNAKRIFIQLINEAKSLRAVYFLGEVFRMTQNYEAARACYQTVMNKTSNRREGEEIWYNNAQVALRTIQQAQGGTREALNQIRIQETEFPERWIQKGIPDMDQWVDPAYFKFHYLQSEWEFFVKFGIFKRTPYPSVYAPNESRFKISDLGTLTGGIREKLENVTSILMLSVLFPEGGSKGVSTILNGIPIDLSPEGTFSREFAIGDTIHLQIKGEGYYPVVKRMILDRPGRFAVKISMTPRLGFRKAEVPPPSLIQFPGRLDNNAIFFETVSIPISGTYLYKTFLSDLNYRDFAYSSFHRGILVVCINPTRVLRFSSESNFTQQEEIPIPDSLKTKMNPEGIAVDPHGTIYITDWSGHRILVFGPDGQFLRTLGSFGENASSNIGKSVFLMYPTRMTVVQEENQEFEQNETVYGPIRLFVSDRNGVHFIDEQGIYLGTPVFSSSEKGAFSTLAVRGTGTKLFVFVYNRYTNQIQCFESVPQLMR